MPLLWVLRDQLKLTGTKFGCGMGLCGSCTIHIDGQATRSCITPVSDVVGVGLVKYWPLNHISTLDAHHDVFKDVPEGSAD